MNRYAINSRSFKVFDGPQFKDEKADKVLDYLKSRQRNEIISPANKFQIFAHDGYLYLKLINGQERSYPVREAFIIKLINWYHLPLRMINLYDLETVIHILNNTLRLIKGRVTVVTENHEALTILSDSYTFIEDVKLIERCSQIGIDSITRNDFFTRIYLKHRESHHIELKKNDIVGYGYNVMNSETGHNSFQILVYILRLICSNGAIIPTDHMGKKFYHYNKDPQEAYNEIDQFPEYLAKFKSELHEQFQRAQNERFEIDKYQDLATLNAILGFPDNKFFIDEYKSWLRVNSTIFTFYDYLTEKANLFDEVTKLELQKLAGRLLFQKQSAISDLLNLE